MSYVLPLTVAITLHIALIIIMSVSFSEPPKKVTKPQPKIIHAKLVERKQLLTPNDKAEAKKLAEKKRLQREQAKKREAERKRQAQRKKEAEAKKQKELALKKKKEAEQKALDAKKSAEQKKRAEEQARLKREQEAVQKSLEQERLEKKKRKEEEQAIQAGKDKALAMSYMASIKETIEYHWSRPPSARNGMEVLLEIHLVPNGTVVEVNVLKSSGNTAFDRAAVLAVKKAEQFPELRDLPSRVFDHYYRTVKLLFKPEDLRL